EMPVRGVQEPLSGGQPWGDGVMDFMRDPLALARDTCRALSFCQLLPGVDYFENQRSALSVDFMQARKSIKDSDGHQRGDDRSHHPAKAQALWKLNAHGDRGTENHRDASPHHAK